MVMVPNRFYPVWFGSDMFLGSHGSVWFWFWEIENGSNQNRTMDIPSANL